MIDLYLTRRVMLAAVFSLAVTACGTDSSMPTEDQMTGLTLSQIKQSSTAQTLDDLRRLTAPLHDIAAAESAGYGLLTIPGLTSPDGCISDMNRGGMGYHYTRGNNLGDNSISLLDPEFIVYAPTNGATKDPVNRRLAALEYFIPYSNVWPGPPAAAPRLHDFPSFAGVPDASMSPTRFGGWAIHIWLWENNPDGMFMNWNTSVPKCDNSPA